MGPFEDRYFLLSMLFIGMFAAGGIVNVYVFWMQIGPVLERLGYNYEPFSLRRYKDGFFKTLYEYKHYQITEKKSLMLWWTYWASLWIAVGGWVCGLVLTLSK